MLLFHRIILVIAFFIINYLLKFSDEHFRKSALKAYKLLDYLSFN